MNDFAKILAALESSGVAGVGFSSTKKDSFTVRVRSGRSQRAYNVRVG